MKIKPFDPHTPRPPLVQLAFDGPLDAELTSINVRRDDKAAFDQVQGWLSARTGRRLTHWETFTIVLAEATARDDGALAGFATWC